MRVKQRFDSFSQQLFIFNIFKVILLSLFILFLFSVAILFIYTGSLFVYIKFIASGYFKL
jgi:hypothetical protein